MSCRVTVMHEHSGPEILSPAVLSNRGDTPTAGDSRRNRHQAACHFERAGVPSRRPEKWIFASTAISIAARTQRRADLIVAKVRAEVLTNIEGVAHWVR